MKLVAFNISDGLRWALDVVTIRQRRNASCLTLFWSVCVAVVVVAIRLWCWTNEWFNLMKIFSACVTNDALFNRIYNFKLLYVAHTNIILVTSYYCCGSMIITLGSIVSYHNSLQLDYERKKFPKFQHNHFHFSHFGLLSRATRISFGLIKKLTPNWIDHTIHYDGMLIGAPLEWNRNVFVLVPTFRLKIIWKHRKFFTSSSLFTENEIQSFRTE